MQTRIIKLFEQTVVITAKGLRRAAELAEGDQFSDNFGNMHSVQRATKGADSRAAHIGVNGHWTSEHLPADGAIKAAKSGTAKMGPYAITDIAAAPSEFSVLLPKRRFNIAAAPDNDTEIDFQNPESLFLLGPATIRRELLFRLMMPEEGDGIKHAAQALYLACDNLVEAKWMALLASAHGVRVQLHPNTPIVYVDHKRPSCFITKLAAGVFHSADGTQVIDEFYGSDLFVPPAEITDEFIAKVTADGAVYEGLPIENFYSISQIQLSTKMYPTRDITIAAGAHIDTAFIQI